MTKDLKLLKEIIDKKFKAKDYIDVVELAHSFGIEVYGRDFQDKTSSFIEFNENGRFNIYVNKHHSKERQRFSIAHEIAHYILHKDEIINNKKVARENITSLSKEKEIKADNLAAEILMPEKWIEKFLKKLKINKKQKLDESIIRKVAKKFNVSAPASIVRLRNLNYYMPYLYL